MGTALQIAVYNDGWSDAAADLHIGYGFGSR